MKTSKLNLLVGFFCVMPWLLASVGAERLLGDTWIFFLGFSFSVMTALIVAFVNQSVVKNREKYFLSNNNSFFQNCLRKLWFYIIVASYFFYCVRVSNILLIHSFDLAAVRYSYFRSSDTLQNIFFNNKFIGMFFAWILNPMCICYLLTSRKFNLKEEWVVVFLYVLSGMMIGGRFSLYHVSVILFLNSFVAVKKIPKFNKKRILTTLIVLALFLFLSLGIGANRAFYTSNQGYSFLYAFKQAFLSVYDYHSLQFGVISVSSGAPMQQGMFTGLLTPFFVFSGLPSPEGQLYLFLDNISFNFGNETGANAFGTSIMFFMPMVDSNIKISIFLFFFSVLLLLFFLAYFVKGLEKLILLKYILFSFYFSAFQPFMFSFSWWLSIFMIVTFCRLGVFRSTKTLGKIRYV